MSSNQIQQDRQVEHSNMQSQHYRGNQVPVHSQIVQNNIGSSQEDYSFELEINQPDNGPQRQVPHSKMKQTKTPSAYIAHQKQKDINIQTIMKDMKKYLLFINNTDWMFQNDQNPVENYFKN
ncbi:hypothetical protein ABPG72_016592 [Tetrahymena utriculariae]